MHNILLLKEFCGVQRITFQGLETPASPWACHPTTRFVELFSFYCGTMSKKKKYCDMWHMTCDTWHVTCDTWHVTRDTLGGWTFSKNCSSLALIVCDLWYYEDMEEKAHGMTELISHKAVYRTAPATPGLLKRKSLLRSRNLVWVVTRPHADQNSFVCWFVFYQDQW